MVPVSWPRQQQLTGATDKLVVFELTSTAGMVAWTDYIPVAVQAAPVAANRARHNDSGYLPFHFLASVTGLTAWRDYIPVDTVAFVQANAWKTDAAGFLPYVDETLS